jgi:hypothetical protein
VHYCCISCLLTLHSHSSSLGIQLTYIETTRTTHHRKHMPRRGPAENTCVHHFFYCCVTSQRTREHAYLVLHSIGLCADCSCIVGRLCCRRCLAVCGYVTKKFPWNLVRTSWNWMPTNARSFFILSSQQRCSVRRILLLLSLRCGPQCVRSYF